MRKFAIRSASMIIILGLFAAFSNGGTIPIGAKAPMTDHPVQDVSGKMVTLAQVAGENGLLVIFSCNTCPWVKAWEGRYATIAEKASAHGIGMIALNPNAAYRNRGDSLDDMKAQASDNGYRFPYALDRDSKLAEAFGATRTPDVFLFDKNLTLVYQGAIDDNARHPESVKRHFLIEAMQAMVDGKSIDPETTKSIGCTIKRNE